FQTLQAANPLMNALRLPEALSPFLQAGGTGPHPLPMLLLFPPLSPMGGEASEVPQTPPILHQPAEDLLRFRKLLQVRQPPADPIHRFPTIRQIRCQLSKRTRELLLPYRLFVHRTGSVQLLPIPGKHIEGLQRLFPLLHLLFQKFDPGGDGPLIPGGLILRQVQEMCAADSSDRFGPHPPAFRQEKGTLELLADLHRQFPVLVQLQGNHAMGLQHFIGHITAKPFKNPLIPFRIPNQITVDRGGPFPDDLRPVGKDEGHPAAGCAGSDKIASPGLVVQHPAQGAQNRALAAIRRTYEHVEPLGKGDLRPFMGLKIFDDKAFKFLQSSTPSPYPNRSCTSPIRASASSRTSSSTPVSCAISSIMSVTARCRKFPPARIC